MLEARFPANINTDPRLKWVVSGGTTLLNLGAGTNPIKGATNHNIVSGPDYQLVFDLTRFPWPLEDQTYDIVAAFHVLEHIPIQHSLRFIQECHRITACNGVLMLEVPDVVGMAHQLLEGNMGIVGRLYGTYEYPGEGHVWGWDRSQLMLISRLGGYKVCITKEGMDYHSGQIPSIRLEAVKH